MVLASAACGGVGQQGAADAEADKGKAVHERVPAAEETVSETKKRGDGEDRSVAGSAGADVRVGGSRVRAGDVVAGAAGTESRTDATNPRGGDGARHMAEGAEASKVTLSITGDRGAAFSGACSVGGTERTVEGRAPERYTLEPRGEDVRCEVRNAGGDALRIVFTDGAGMRSEQRSGGGSNTTRFVYSDGGISSTSTTPVEQGTARFDGSSTG